MVKRSNTTTLKNKLAIANGAIRNKRIEINRLKQVTTNLERSVQEYSRVIETLKKTIASQEKIIDDLETKAENKDHNFIQVQKHSKLLETWREINLSRIRAQDIAMELMAQEIDKLRKTPKMVLDE